MKKLIPDQAQREAALNPTQSFIVQAPAGSGKTELLTQRFLRLLSCVNEPEEILAITFTKKAASEMRARIRDALSKAQAEPLPEAEHAQKTWRLAQAALKQDQERNWGLLANPNRLRVKTIDAFNALLTRQLPLLSQFGAAPEIVDFPQNLYRDAVQTSLTHLEEDVAWSDSIAQLLLHLDNNQENTEKGLIELLSKRDQWLPRILGRSALRETLEANLQAVIEENLARLRELFPRHCVADLLSLLRYADGNLRIKYPEKPPLLTQHLSDLPGTHPEDKALWLELAEFLLTQGGTWRKKVDVRDGFPPAESKKAKEADPNVLQIQKMKDLLEDLSQHEDLHQALTDVMHLPDARYSETQWAALSALREMLKIAVVQLQETFKLTGKIDYTQNSLAALLALGNEDEPTDLALVLDYQLKHILVDEFQDTSSSQFALLQKLVRGWQDGDGRSLFLVGDPMQSIYRFREADVGLFLHARQHGLGSVGLTPLTLSVNFRSTPAFVDWINNHFNHVLPTHDESASGAVSYTPSTSKDELQPAEKPAVHLHLFSQGEAESQTQGMVRLIQAELQDKPNDKIAILVRSRSHLKALIPALIEAKLPYQAVDIDPLESRPMIQDLLALTRALLYPADHIAWLSVLRAPWCGLSLNDLLTIAGLRKQELIWQRLLLPQIEEQLSPAGKKSLARILPVFKTALAERHREDLHLWLEKTWQALGGPACLTHEHELQDAKIFFTLLKKLTRTETSLNLKWQSLENALQDLFAQSSKRADCRIQIMTIHNAKGLEFDTVILPHLEKGANKNKNALLAWIERPLDNNASALLMAPVHAVGDPEDATYEYIRRLERNKSQHEQGRLLYVAATRAKKALHLCMSLEAGEKNEYKKPTDGSMLKKLWPAVQAELGPCELTSLAVKENKVQPRTISRLSESWVHPLPPTPAPERPAHNKIQGFHLSQKEAPIIGTVVHYLLQQITRFSLTWWQKQASTQRQAYLERLLLKNGILPPQIPASVAKVEKAITNTLADERGQWLLQNRPEAQSEYALSAVFDGEVKMLVVDRTFVDDQGLRWIIDYKTAAPESQSLPDFLKQEKDKYADKMRDYQEALSLLHPGRIRLGLYFPLVSGWCEWENN